MVKKGSYLKPLSYKFLYYQKNVENISHYSNTVVCILWHDILSTLDEMIINFKTIFYAKK